MMSHLHFFGKGMRILFFLLFPFYSASAQSGGAQYESGPVMNRTRIVPMCATLPDNRVVLFGGREVGFVSSFYSDIYDPYENTFTERSMSDAHDGCNVLRLNDGRYLVMGGSANLGVAPGYTTVEVFDPTDNSFSLLDPMQVARMQHNAALLTGGEVLIAGAWYNDFGAQNPEIYYPNEDGTNGLTGALVTPRSGPQVLPTDDGNAVVFGGYGVYGTPNYTSVEEYDAETNSFSVLYDELIPGEPGWLTYSYINNRPSANYKMSDGRYVFLAYRSSPDLEYALVTFDPSTKVFARVATSSPLLSGIVTGGIYDAVLDPVNNLMYVLGAVADADPAEVALIGVDLTSGYTQHPAQSFVLPSGEYLYPTLSYIPSNNSILLVGVSSTSGDYFHATNKTYILNPDELVGIREEVRGDALSVYPNPARDLVQLSMNFQSGGIASIRVYDSGGRLVHSEQRTAAGGHQLWRFDTAHMSPGLYDIQVMRGEEYRTARLVVE